MRTAQADSSSTPRRVPAWPRYPVLYEISTWVWLSDLSERHGKPIDLASVPSSEWDAIAVCGFDAVWLMGVWERSPAGIARANQNPRLIEDFRRALPDFRPEDNVGSPYCVRRYVVDPRLGGPAGLAIARAELASRGMRLLLDWVPNHVAPDHPWVYEHPEYFIRGNSEDARNDPSSFIDVGGVVFACGRDPFFPAWPDVLQLNVFEPGLRQAAMDTLSHVARQCDGVRCDMAMLLLNSIFERTWGGRTGPRPATEYWENVISAIKGQHSDFLFIAEAYWDLEWELQQKGFDFCYDKKLYDRLEHSDAESIRLHLCAEPAYQNKLVRFLENHDEPRAAAIFPSAKLRAASLTVAALPGAKLFYEGQLVGRQVRLPVFLGRRPAEPVDEDLQAFFRKLLSSTNRPVFHDGEWRLCRRTGHADDTSFQNVVAWCWRQDDERYLMIVNLSDWPAQARVQIPWADLAGRTWLLADTLSDSGGEALGNEMDSPGLFVELGPWAYHLFRVSAAAL